MLVIFLIVLILVLASGGGWGYSSGRLGVGDPLSIILIVLLVLLVFGGIGPHLGWYHW